LDPVTPKFPSHKGARIALAIVALLVLIGGIDRGRAWLAHRARVFEIERLRVRVVDLRSDVESCRTALDRERNDFDRYRASVDSLRETIRVYESLDERGVPADRYEAYLETFRRYNQSLPGWRARADSLTAHDDICRDLTVEHNVVAESLRANLEAAGVSSFTENGALP
jgi:hypothetical protein